MTDLRQQLTDAIKQAFADFYSGGAAACCEGGVAYGLEGWIVGRVAPVFDDLVAAARQETAQLCADEIEKFRDSRPPNYASWYVGMSCAARLIRERVSAALVRETAGEDGHV